MKWEMFAKGLVKFIFVRIESPLDSFLQLKFLSGMEAETIKAIFQREKSRMYNSMERNSAFRAVHLP